VFLQTLYPRGTKTWKDGNKYKGDFKNYAPDGKGVYEWTSGVKYDGGLKYGRCHGDGSVTWPTGFQYSKGFDLGVPKDRNACLHPNIHECIEKGECTGSLTKKNPGIYGQFFYTCATCSDTKEYCASCIKTCHIPGHEWKLQWACSIFHCECYDHKKH